MSDEWKQPYNHTQMFRRRFGEDRLVDEIHVSAFYGIEEVSTRWYQRLWWRFFPPKEDDE